MNTNEMELAVKWFNSKDIPARIVNDDVVITVNDYEIYINSSEVIYRAELWQDENDGE